MLLNRADIKYKVINAGMYGGVPQHRERIYIVCFLDRTAYDLFDFEDMFLIEPDNIKDYLESDVDDKYYYNERFKNI